MKKIEYVKIKDYRNYVSGKSSDGGCYSYTTTYTAMGDGTFAITHSTSADFAYCEYCGMFMGVEECPCGYERQIVSAEDILADVLFYGSQEGFDISWDWVQEEDEYDEDEYDEDEYDEYDDEE